MPIIYLCVLRHLLLQRSVSGEGRSFKLIIRIKLECLLGQSSHNVISRLNKNEAKEIIQWVKMFVVKA